MNEILRAYKESKEATLKQEQRKQALEQLERAKSGRRVNPNEQLQLVDTDLRGENLSGADLRSAYLYKVRLDGVNLKGADLRHARISSSLLTGANLANADLSGADISLTDMKNSNLTGANLGVGRDQDSVPAKLSYEVHLEDANLKSANLLGVEFRRVFFDRANLENVQFGDSGVGQMRYITKLIDVRGITWEQLKSATIKSPLTIRIPDEHHNDWDDRFKAGFVIDVQESERRGDYIGALSKINLFYNTFRGNVAFRFMLSSALNSKIDLLVKLNRLDEALEVEETDNKELKAVIWRHRGERLVPHSETGNTTGGTSPYFSRSGWG